MIHVKQHLSPQSPTRSSRCYSQLGALLLGVGLLGSLTPQCWSQDAQLAEASQPVVPFAIAALPDAPVPAALGTSSSLTAAPEDALPEAPQDQLNDPRIAHGTQPSQRIAQKKAKTIPAGWTGQRLSYREQVVLGATDLYSLESFAAMFVSAGYAHVTNGQPNYGTDKGAFGERLGAAAIRETSQGVFTDMVFAQLLHEDTRYYAEGIKYNPFHRTLYAITRPLITRKDTGGNTVNGALLLGYAASAALTPAFYPSINQNFRDTAYTYAGSIGGSALGFFVSEFSNDMLYTLHLRRTP